jgi:hypothetical protein
MHKNEEQNAAGGQNGDRLRKKMEMPGIYFIGRRSSGRDCKLNVKKDLQKPYRTMVVCKVGSLLQSQYQQERKEEKYYEKNGTEKTGSIDWRNCISSSKPDRMRWI